LEATATFEAMHGIPIGVPVYDAAGVKVGRVRWADPLGLAVERGWLFHTESEIPLDEVDRYQDGKLYLKRTKSEVLGCAG
jgi:hypothetical protein